MQKYIRKGCIIMKITVCIGSSCHIKGSRQVADKLQQLITKHNLKRKIDLGGAFCMGHCQDGVCVTVNGGFYSVTPDNIEDFFYNKILPELQ